MEIADLAFYKHNICKNSTTETISHFESACQTHFWLFHIFMQQISNIASNKTSAFKSFGEGKKQQYVSFQTQILQKSVKNHAASIPG